MNRQALERLGQVHRFAAISELERARSFLRGVADQCLGEGHEVLVIPVRCVEFHHGEFRVVAHRDAFVAEAAVDLEHAIEPAHDQALQVQLGRDAQKHLLVQRIVVRGEGFGIGAARNGVQHGRLHLQKLVRHHELADAADRLAAGREALAGVFVHHQIDVALAVLDFLVVDAVKLVRHRAQAFGQQAYGGGVNRQLAGFGLENGAFGSHDVAQVPVFEAVVKLGADVFALDVDLDSPSAVLQGTEAGLAHDALEHHASRHFGHSALFDQAFRCLAGMCGKQVGGVVCRLEIIGECNPLAFCLLLADGLELLAALQDQLVFINGSGSGVLV